MKTLTILLITLLLSSAATAQVNKSLLPVWARVDHRTQGGGWLWFPGKGIARTEYQADIIARGSALDYLIQECSIPHKSIRFVERFVTSWNNKYYVFVRANISQNDCEFSRRASSATQKKLLSRKLSTVYVEYKQLMTQKQINYSQCHYQNNWCLKTSVEEFQLGNDYKALAYAKYSCRKGMKYGCQAARNYIKFLSENPY